MSQGESTFYLTTPIYYVNDRPHIGHVYTTTVADVVARYHRLMGQRVFFLTGTDEHAAKVVDAAQRRSLSPQQWADQNAETFRQTFERLGMSHDDFIRTSEPRHKQRVSRYVGELLDSGDVYAGQYEGWYDAGQEEYVPEAKAKEYDYKSPIGGQLLIRKKEKNYFFRLSRYGTALLDWLERNRHAVLPEARRNEVIGRINEGLADVPISRTGTGGWGIPVPGDPEQTIYVWIDALFNYLTTIDTDQRRSFWPANVHLIGKDILWFHAVIWPAVLMALSKRPAYDWVEVPGTIWAHSFWISEGQKMGKSLGNFVDLEKLDQYIDRFGLDALRYYMATQGPMQSDDADFAESRFIEVYNADLANTLGNCLNRIINMTQRYFDGKLPPPLPRDGSALFQFAGQSDVAFVQACLADYRSRMEQFHLAAAAQHALKIVRAIDAYIEAHQPFKLARKPGSGPQVGTMLATCAEAMRCASIALWPFMPGKVETIWQRLGCDGYSRALASNGPGQWDGWTGQWPALKAGTPVSGGPALFARHT